jgi:hypothetical protein
MIWFAVGALVGVGLAYLINPLGLFRGPWNL